MEKWQIDTWYMIEKKEQESAEASADQKSSCFGAMALSKSPNEGPGFVYYHYCQQE